MLAELTGKDRGTVKRRLAGIEPVEIKTKGHYYDLKTALKLIFEPFSEKLEDSESGFINPILEKAYLDRARRISQEIDNKVKLKELIPKSQLHETLTYMFGAIRSKLLNIPLKASQSLPPKPTKAQLNAHLKTQITEILKELSEKNFNESL